MATITLTKHAGQLGPRIVALRRSALKAGPNESREDTGLQRIGLLTSNAGDTFTCYWDPDTATIFYDDGTPNLGQQ